MRMMGSEAPVRATGGTSSVNVFVTKPKNQVSISEKIDIANERSRGRR